MRNVKLSKRWDSLRATYWFLPSIMALAGMALAFATLALDQAGEVKTGDLNWIYTGGPEGARGLLSAVASSMVTVAATAFSITIEVASGERPEGCRGAILSVPHHLQTETLDIALPLAYPQEV